MEDSDSRKKHWPRDSLKRALSREFPGCETAIEAFYMAVNSKQNDTAPQAPIETKEEFFLKEAIEQIGIAQKDLDIDKISLHLRAELAKMPVTTIDEISLWRDAWLSQIEKLSW